MTLPIEMPNGDWLKFRKEKIMEDKRGDYFIRIENRYVGFITINGVGVADTTHWMISDLHLPSKALYMVKGDGPACYVRRDQFFGFLLENYPEHFEWMIWNLL
jgi:hypothetical protein